MAEKPEESGEIGDLDEDDTSEDVTSPERSRLRFRKIASFCWSLAVLLVFIGGGVLLGGFLRYVSIVTSPTPVLEAKADGIVVLTGGENRLRRAATLLSKGYSERLLVTGVNPKLSSQSFQKVVGVSDELLDCCVQIDRLAKDTIGNALAAQKWNEQVKAKSLIVVTGAFHMPRAIKELSHALPKMKLIAVPVNVPEGEAWWRDQSRLRDLVREYAKFAVITGRDAVNEFMDWPWPTMLGRNTALDAEFKNATNVKELEPRLRTH